MRDRRKFTFNEVTVAELTELAKHGQEPIDGVVFGYRSSDEEQEHHAITIYPFSLNGSSNIRAERAVDIISMLNKEDRPSPNRWDILPFHARVDQTLEEAITALQENGQPNFSRFLLVGNDNECAMIERIDGIHTTVQFHIDIYDHRQCMDAIFQLTRNEVYSAHGKPPALTLGNKEYP